MKDEAIKYFPDGYSQWERNQSEIEVKYQVQTMSLPLACKGDEEIMTDSCGVFRRTTTTSWMPRPARKST